MDIDFLIKCSQDKNLSTRALGLLLRMQQLQNEHSLLTSDLIRKNMPEGATFYRSALNELKEAGYLQIEQGARGRYYYIFGGENAKR